MLLQEAHLFVKKVNLVPIVEPEVLINGTHSIDECDKVTRKSLSSLFSHLKMFNVYLPGTVLKPSMVISGQENDSRARMMR